MNYSDNIMHILKYNLDYKTNLENLKRDLYICLSSRFESEDIVLKYTDEFVVFFNKINRIIIV